MVYVTVGNHDQPFDRLLKKMDDIAGNLGLPVVMQTGHGRYVPRNADYLPFFPFNRAEDLIKNADAVVGHAGIGTVISARKWGVPLVICPRRRERGEHFNDHQLEICNELLEHPRPLVEVAMDTDEIEGKLAELLEKGRGAGLTGAAPDLVYTIKQFLATI